MRNIFLSILLTLSISTVVSAVEYTDGTAQCWNAWKVTFTAGDLTCNSDNTIVVDTSGTAGAPTDATYITQTTNATLSAEQALDALSTGILRVNTADGVLTSLTDSSGISDNISDETGSGALCFATSPTFTTSIIMGSADLNEAELEILDGATVTTSELNVPLDGALVTLTEFQELETINATIISTGNWTAVSSLSGTNTGDATHALDLVTTAPITGAQDNVFFGADGDVTIAMPAATTSQDGYITQTDWDTFNDHAADNTQAHSDYLINNGNDSTSGVLTATGFTLGDDENLSLGVAPDWTVNYDESVDNQLLFLTTNTAAIATTDPMFEILVGTTPTADQQVFGVAKGSQATNTALFTVDEDGDVELLGTVTLTTSADSAIKFNNTVTADPCGTGTAVLDDGALFFTSGGHFCYCDDTATSVDLLIVSDAACTY